MCPGLGIKRAHSLHHLLVSGRLPPSAGSHSILFGPDFASSKKGNNKTG